MGAPAVDDDRLIVVINRGGSPNPDTPWPDTPWPDTPWPDTSWPGAPS